MIAAIFYQLKVTNLSAYPDSYSLQCSAGQAQNTQDTRAYYYSVDVSGQSSFLQYPFWQANPVGLVNLNSFSSGLVAATSAPNFHGGFIRLPYLPSGASGGPFPPSGFTIEFWSMTTICNDPNCGGAACQPYNPGSTGAVLLSAGNIPANSNDWANVVSITQNCGCAQGVPHGGCNCTAWNDPLCGQTINAQVSGTAWSVSVKSPPLGVWAHLAFVFTSAPAIAGRSGAADPYNLVASAYVNGALAASSAAQQTGPPPDPVRVWGIFRVALGLTPEILPLSAHVLIRLFST